MCIHINIHICMYIYVYIYMYMYIYIYIAARSWLEGMQIHVSSDVYKIRVCAKRRR